jgi:hypothetical protein
MIYDALDLMRASRVFLNCVPWASLVALRAAALHRDHLSQVIGYSDPMPTPEAWA